MKSIHIKIDMINVQYPVGEDMNNCITVIDNYISAFQKVICNNSLINLWCTGSSGAILATIFALKYDKPCKICHVKKNGESSHSSPMSVYHIEGYNVVIDDFVSSGATIQRIINYMQNNNVTPDALMVCSGGERFVTNFDYVISS